MQHALTLTSLCFTLVVMNSACTPQVEVVAKEPININLNVKIEHEIRVKVDKELDSVFSENKGLF
ncbi:MAG: YnbE family lipoprotein [Thioalkalispiraceae bacterium]|jgi:hypothetical protein